MDLRTQREFLIDIEELVEQLFANTDELRRQEGRGPQRRELLARIFRDVHSIKGVAATAGFENVSKLAHQTESLLEKARSGRLAIEDRFVETLEEAANAISESVSAVAGGAEVPPPADLIQSFRDFDLHDAPLENGAPLPDLPDSIAASLNESEKQLLGEAVQENENLYLVTAEFDLAVFDKDFHSLRTTLTQLGAVISALPSAANSRPDQVEFRILFASAFDEEQLRNSLGKFPQAIITQLARTSDTETAKAPTVAATAQPAGGPAPLTSFVRIEIEELDRLISAAHELFGQTVAALDLVSDTLAAGPRAELKNLDVQIRESLVALEDRIIQLRMVPLDRVIQRGVRAGRVAARVSGKNVEFLTVGGEMRVDKAVCDAVADPLLHLVRNAVDQGIESSDERVLAGKASAGTVRIEANSGGGLVRFLVSDDGRGIDPQVVSQAAAKLGIVEEGTLLSSEKSLRLIFRPGFSTAATVSSVSGRGVGLNIVESAIERAGGAVRVRTEVGRGTEFEIRLPASLGVLRALVLISEGQRYCVDASQIVDQVEYPSESKASDSIPWRQDVLRVASLRALLAQTAAESNDSLLALICEFPSEAGTGRNNRQAVVVDSIEGTEEVLVRGLGRHSALWPGVVGATELRDGAVALVLDLPLLLSLSHSRSQL